MYELRTDSGHLFAKVSNSIAQRIINSTDGEFRTYVVDGKPDRNAWIFTRDMHFGLSDFALILYSGYKLIPIRGE